MPRLGPRRRRAPAPSPSRAVPQLRCVPRCVHGPRPGGAVGRKWPTDLERDPTIAVIVYDEDNPYDYVEVRGHATGTTDRAREHIDRLAKKYLGADEYPFHQPGEQRITFLVDAHRVRHQKQR